MKYYLNQIEKNYDIVYDHFKEQDQLRNTAFGFFTTLSLAVIGFIDEDTQVVPLHILFLGMFVLGVLFSVLMCRYKYYGNLYSITMKKLRNLYNTNETDDIKLLIDEIISSKVKTYSIRKIYSADFIIYLCLVLINMLNLIIFLNCFVMRLYIKVTIIVIFIVLSICEYNFLVIQKSKRCKAKDLSFIDSFYSLYKE